ncbi:MAG: PQQ-binding-like beta-propeller repeat protein [Candidatus Bathyarchaeota archaeon]|nr:PQQ-binding-like beta-propeller repeat protein [Candidatus Bathyarchaeota archaeon]
MQLRRNKTFAAAVVALLVLTIGASVALPITEAHTPPWTIEAWCYAGVTPRTIGVNQDALIVFWINWVPPTVGTDSRFGDRWIFYVNITAPDGSKETLGPYKSDPVGGSWTTYTPTQVGTYTIVAYMPAYKITGLPSATGVPITSDYINDTYGPATSEAVYLTVQEEPIQAWQETPLPTQYWTRPINAANRNWDVLAGNWLGGAAQSVAPGASNYGVSLGFAPNDLYAYGPGPESAHVMWTKPYYAGGIMDVRFGNTGYETAHYQGINLGNPIIIQGKLIVPYRNTAHTTTGWWVLDLYTGETLSFQNTSTIPAFGQIYNYESPNQHGGFPYLWRTSGVTLPSGYTSASGTQTWEMLDGFTLETVTKIANVSATGTNVYGKDGSILYYNIVNLGTTASPKRYLQVWNSSATPTLLQGTTGTNFWQWRPARLAVHDGSKGFSLNVSVPDVQGSILSVREDEYVIGGTSGKNNGTYVLQGHLWALSLKRGQEGTLLWNVTFTPPLSTSDIVAGSGLTSYGVAMGAVDPEDGVFLFEHRLTLKRWGYSLATGQMLWGPTPPEEPFHFYGMSEAIYKGKLYSYGYGGAIRAYNITTGEILWTYNATTVGFESPYGGLYPIGIACIADGKLYTVSSEHSPTQPLWRGPNLRCLDADTGEELWKILFWGARMSPVEPNVYIADGRLVGLNYYDMQLYCFGKGPSATTVAASPEVSVHGNSVLVKGTVTDQTPAAKGTPAISDEDMSAWMEYLYMQQAMPQNAKGVEVTLDALDPNGNFVNIGTVTSDLSGNFAKAFVPEVPGLYTIIATFAGSKSYYGSYAETFVQVDEAPPATAPPEYPQPFDYTWTIVGMGLVLLVAIVVVGILLLRKK